MAFSTPRQSRPAAIGVINRGNGWYTPVVALDELPSHFLVSGLPRNLNYDQIEGYSVLGEWRHTGHFAEASRSVRSSRHIPARSSPVAAPILPFRRPSMETSHASHPSGPHRSSSASEPDNVGSTVESTHSHGPGQQGRIVHGSLKNNQIATKATSNSKVIPQAKPQRIPPSGVKPDLSKKTHCTHWLRTGTCGFIQQGCLYKHEIPGSQEEWTALGFRDIPLWIRDSNATRHKGVPLYRGAKIGRRFGDAVPKLRSHKHLGDHAEVARPDGFAEIKHTTIHAPNSLMMNPPTPVYPHIAQGTISRSRPEKSREEGISLTRGCLDGDMLVELESRASSCSSSPATVVGRGQRLKASCSTTMGMARPLTDSALLKDDKCCHLSPADSSRSDDRDSRARAPQSRTIDSVALSAVEYKYYFPRGTTNDGNVTAGLAKSKHASTAPSADETSCRR